MFGKFIISLYKKKYGEFSKKIELSKNYSFFFNMKPASKTPVDVTKQEIYSWNSKPTLKIEYTTIHHLLNFVTGEKIDNYSYRIKILYYSKQFLKRFNEIDNKDLINKMNESQNRKSLQTKDI